MLASQYRLKAARDITRVFKTGRYGVGGEITAKARKTDRTDSRLVTVVSKKVSKKAVVRNKIRRRISGICETLWATVNPGYDIVVTVRGNVADLESDPLRRDVIQALTRAGVLTKG